MSREGGSFAGFRGRWTMPRRDKTSPPRVTADSKLPASPSRRLRREKAAAPETGTPVISGREIREPVCGPPASSAPRDICACLPKEGQSCPHPQRVRSPQ
ncbi:unnamed protein product [Rangifer tarandus platyrhynchus]|uniref:Uncharacterized protein n=1 Tax=Rangifer tarandus platyrhynchus TaxID=3082113 RepID=A0ABN8XZ42_RANTA|nr:unnamed protein product [Rangifer tarandus platyrhynchus]